MRIKRLKQYRKYANLFKMNHSFDPPYKFLIDGSFLHMAVKTNTRLKDVFGRIFQDDVALVTTKCIVDELMSMGEGVQKAVNTCKTFLLEPCNHEGQLSADECIKLKIGDRNRFKFILCTLDFDLQKELTEKLVVPVFYFKQMVLIMAQPSEYIKHKIAIKEHMNQDLNPEDKEFIKSNIQEIQKLRAKEKKEEKLKKLEEEKPLHLMYKKKVAKGPNPLSVRKTKRSRGDGGDHNDDNDDSKKKRRKRTGNRKKRDEKADSKANDN